MRLRVLSLVMIFLVLPLVSSARAHWLKDWERWVGVGTSDGYHARTGCPPKRAPATLTRRESFPATWSVAGRANQPANSSGSANTNR